jgi:hypothetical protein
VLSTQLLHFQTKSACYRRSKLFLSMVIPIEGELQRISSEYMKQNPGASSEMIIEGELSERRLIVRIVEGPMGIAQNNWYPNVN